MDAQLLDDVTRARDALLDIRARAVPGELLLTFLTDLASALQARYRFRDDDFSDVAERVDLLREASTIPDVHASRADRVRVALASALYDRGLHRSQAEDFNEVISLLESGYNDSDVDAAVLLGSALRSRYISAGKGTDLEKAFQLHRPVLDMVASVPRRHRVKWLCEFARTSFEWSRFTSDRTELVSCIELLRQAISLCEPNEDIEYIPHLIIGRALIFYSAYNGDSESAGEAVEHARYALSACGYGHRDYYDAASTLAVTLYLKSWQFHDMAELDECIDTTAVILPNHGCSDLRPLGCITNGALALEMRYRKHGRTEDLEESISRIEALLQTFPSHITPRPELLNTMSNAYFTRFRTTGDPKDAEKAVEAAMRILATTDPRNKRRGDWISHLASCRMQQYYSFGDLAYVDEALKLQEEAFSLQMGDRGVSWELVITSLAETYRLRYQDTGNKDDLERAVRLGDEWLEKRSPNDSNAASYLQCIAINLRLRFELTDDGNDLERSIHIFNQAEELFTTNVDADQLPSFYIAFAHAYYLHFLRTNNTSDAHRALTLQERALELVPYGHPERSPGLLGFARLKLSPNSPLFDAHSGLQYLQEALNLPHTSPHLRIRDSLPIFASLASLEFDKRCNPSARSQLLAVYRQTVHLLPHIASLGLAVRTRLQVLSKSASLVSQAAYYAIALGDAPTAVEMLEVGRGVFWTQHLRIHAQFDDLPPELALPLAQISRVLGMPLPEGTGDDDGRAATERELARRRSLGQEFENLVRKTQAIPGFETFMRSLDFENLSVAAERSPIVILLSGELTSHALVIAAKRHAELIELPKMTGTRLVQLARHHIAEHQETRRTREAKKQRMRSFRVVPVKVEEEIDVYSELWHCVMQPILTTLGFSVSESMLL
jgi:tetratricopeptide (TPR) repeat protein